jgi:hypothetical protein
VNVPTKLGAFGLALVMIGVAGAGLGAIVGPIGDEPDVLQESETVPTSVAVAAEGGELPAGLSASDGGLNLRAADTTFRPGVAETFTFEVARFDGVAVTAFQERHEREMHLVVVSQDLVEFQHVHPVLDSDGTWSIPLTLPRAGTYRAYADFAAAGADPLTLSATLNARGELAPRALPGVSRHADVDGYEVTLEGELAAGADSELRFGVSRDGVVVEDLEPYLGAFGHLVAIRGSDLGYLHVHPTDDSSPADVGFALRAPSPGAYRLFLDFQHGGVVRTAAFTIEVPAGNAPMPAHHVEESDDGGH